MLFPIGPFSLELEAPLKPKSYIYRQGTSAFIAPTFSASEIMALRAHIDEAKNDPDYDVVISYEYRWDDDVV
jgi:hypothetical protein